MYRRNATGLIAAVAVISAVISSVSSCGSDEGRSAATSSAADTTMATTMAAATAATPEALRFTAPLVGGGELDMATYAGQPLLLWFWAPY